MARVVFLDTSVLLNVLNVPRKNGERAMVLPRFRDLVKAGAVLIIPMAAVIEVGNHIAQLPGDSRHARATVFEDFLRKSVEGTPPWVVAGTSWDETFLRDLVEGHAVRPGVVALCVQSIGTGDGSILLEVERYKQRSDMPSAQPIELWSLDTGLSSHGEMLLGS